MMDVYCLPYTHEISLHYNSMERFHCVKMGGGGGGGGVVGVHSRTGICQ